MAREIHDERGQVLTAVKINLDWLERNLGERENDTTLNPLLDRVIGEAADPQQALAAAEKERWDAVLLDINMPGRSGLEVLQDLKRLHSQLPVVILSAFPEKDYAIRAFKLGAAGYVSKQGASIELLAALRKALAGAGTSLPRWRRRWPRPWRANLPPHPTNNCPTENCRSCALSPRAGRSRKSPANLR